MTPLVKRVFPKPQVLVRCLRCMPHIRLGPSLLEWAGGSLVARDGTPGPYLSH
jgi:hypothetical protein